MNYLNLSLATWDVLKSPDPKSGGYPSIKLQISEETSSFLHLFRDQSGYYHFALEASDIGKADIEDPKVNGLQVQLSFYKFETGNISQFIDLTCSITAYLVEFTEVVREICKLIFVNKERPQSAVNQIIRNWISFWAIQRKEMLSEEDQIGLICELIILNKLCEINPTNALKIWTGPLGEKHDFNLIEWNLEVKGTRNSQRVHIINGIDQLQPSKHKNLAFISFQLTTSLSECSVNLPDLIDSVIKNHLEKKPNLIVRFNELLARTGYSPVYAVEYRKFNVEIIETKLFEVDADFPKLTSSMLNEPLNTRVSSIRYEISLVGIPSTDFNEINWRHYFD